MVRNQCGLGCACDFGGEPSNNVEEIPPMTKDTKVILIRVGCDLLALGVFGLLVWTISLFVIPTSVANRQKSDAFFEGYHKGQREGQEEQKRTHYFECIDKLEKIDTPITIKQIEACDE